MRRAAALVAVGMYLKKLGKGKVGMAQNPTNHVV